MCESLSDRVRALREYRELLAGPVSVAGEVPGRSAERAGNIWFPDWGCGTWGYNPPGVCWLHGKALEVSNVNEAVGIQSCSELCGKESHPSILILGVHEHWMPFPPS